MTSIHAHIANATHPTKDKPVNMFLYIKWTVQPKQINTTADFAEIEEIADRFCELAGKDMYYIKAPTRRREYVRYRQALTYFIKKYTTASLKQIGDFMGGFDHTTVINSCRKVELDMETNEGYKRWLERLDPMKH